MKTTMYVIVHNKASIPRIPSCVSLFVGAALHPAGDGFDERDDTGENISEKNLNYCELTGLYWIWKNSAADIVGISHYRRFFSKRAVSGSPKHFVTGKEMEALLAKKRIVLPLPKCLSKTALLAVNYAPNRADVKELYEAVAACAPDCLGDFTWYFAQNKTPLFNMCIMKKGDFDAYCSWLFPILFHVEKKHDMAAETDPYRRRLFGFLSERLLPVWVHHYLEPSDVAGLPAINTSESDLTRIRRWCGNVFRNAVFSLGQKWGRQRKAHEELAARIFGGREEERQGSE